MKRIFLSAIIFSLFLIPCSAQDLNQNFSPTQSEKADNDILLPIDINGKWGFIDATGKIIITPQFLAVRGFSDGLAPFVSESNQKYGYINTKGEIVISPQFDNADPFTNGVAQVRLGGNNDPQNYIPSKIGFIDKSGKIIIPPQFEAVDNFHEGLAMARAGKKWGYINLKGEFVIKPQFKFALEFSEGLAVVMRGNKIGFIDKTGKFVIVPRFDNARQFKEDLAPVKFKKYGNWGYIDKTGKLVLEAKYYYASPFTNGFASQRTKDGNICINKEGHQVNEIKCKRFSEGLAPIRVNGRMGFIDESGKIVIESQWDYVSDFRNGVAFFLNYDKNNKCDFYLPGTFDMSVCKWGYIDKTGKVIWKRE
jgi:hypothetical protein